MPIYEVQYSVVRTEWYRVEADNPDHAKAIAFEEGEEMENSSDCTSVEAIDVEADEERVELADPLQGEYDLYFTRCEAANKTPLPYAKWLVARDV